MPDNATPIIPADELATAGTRDRLVHAGLRLFADQGLNAVSLRRIVQEAGAGNRSALHYHFGGRDGLVAAIVDDLQAWLSPRWQSQLAAVTSHMTLRTIVEALFDPVLELQQTPDLGLPAVRFIARLGWDFGPSGQHLSAQLHRDALTRAHSLAQSRLPRVTPQVLQLRLIFAMNNVYHGLADRSYMQRSPFGPLPMADPARGDTLRRVFFDYLEAGLRGPTDQ